MTAMLWLAAGAAWAQAPAGRIDGPEFLARNRGAPGVVALPSGLEYRVFSSGPQDGGSPRPQDEVTVHYEGRLLDGTVFDSSFQRGVAAHYTLERLIPAWVEALQLMHPGDRWIVWAPPELAYGDAGAGPIPGGAVLEFRIELIAFEAPALAQGDRF